MEVNGSRAKIKQDPVLDLFREEIPGINGSTDFYGKTPTTLRKAFKNSLYDGKSKKMN